MHQCPVHPMQHIPFHVPSEAQNPPFSGVKSGFKLIGAHQSGESTTHTTYVCTGRWEVSICLPYSGVPSYTQVCVCPISTRHSVMLSLHASQCWQKGSQKDLPFALHPLDKEVPLLSKKVQGIPQES